MKRESKFYRLYKKLFINNLRRVGFGFYFYVFERLKDIYKEFIGQRCLKRLKVQYPVISLISLDDIELLIHIGSRGYIEDRLIIERKYEMDILEIAHHFIKPNSLILDVGANLGFYSLYFAKKYPDCKIFGYEPVTFIFDSFLKSKYLNGLTNLDPCKMAVGANHTKLEIYGATQDTYNKGTSSIKVNHDINETFTTENIRVVPLNDFLKEPRKVSFIKIDVQGFEKDVFEGAWDLIKRDKPAIVFEHSDLYYEAPRETRKDIAEKFQMLNYEIYFIRSGRFVSQYHFLQKIDFSTSSVVSGDFLAVPLFNAIPSNMTIHS